MKADSLLGAEVALSWPLLQPPSPNGTGPVKTVGGRLFWTSSYEGGRGRRLEQLAEVRGLGLCNSGSRLL